MFRAFNPCYFVRSGNENFAFYRDIIACRLVRAASHNRRTVQAQQAIGIFKSVGFTERGGVSTASISLRLGVGRLVRNGAFQFEAKTQISAVIGEEIGFVGLFFLFGLIFFIIYRGVKIAVSSKDYYGYVLAMGITCVYGIQSLVNALVVTGSIPPTGLPLPLVSAGNTSLIVFLFLL